MTLPAQQAGEQHEQQSEPANIIEEAKKRLGHNNPPDTRSPLDRLRDEIAAGFKEVDQHEGRAEAARIAVGRKLIEARALVDAGHRHSGGAFVPTWTAWCGENVPGRSLRDIRKVMKLARADDPAAAHEAEKAGTRDRVAKHRAYNARSVAASASPQDTKTESGISVSPGAAPDAEQAPVPLAEQAEVRAVCRALAATNEEQRRYIWKEELPRYAPVAAE
jgi:hypothetical protein